MLYMTLTSLSLTHPGVKDPHFGIISFVFPQPAYSETVLNECSVHNLGLNTLKCVEELLCSVGVIL